MSNPELAFWTTTPSAKTWTHVVKGSFADPQLDTRGATDLFCYDQKDNVGAFFATVKNGHLDNGQPVTDGLHQVGANLTFSRRWTHVVSSPFASPFPTGVQILLYDATAGVGEFYAADGNGHLVLKHHHTGWRTSWTQIIPGHFGKANLLFYDAAAGTGEFYSVDGSGQIHLVKTDTGWRGSWTEILTGNFSSSPYDDLLFYDKSAGVGEFYKTDGSGNISLFSPHTNWRTSWKQIVSGQFQPNSSFDGLLFYEEGSGYTEIYATDGHGSISQIPVHFADQWSLKWQTLLAGIFAPNLGNISLSSLCGYDPTDGKFAAFFFK